MNPPNQINREQFEAWLFSQPDERIFKYSEGASDSPTGCLVCNFLREATNVKEFSVGSSDQGISFGNDGFHFVKVEWLASYLSKVCYFAANDTNKDGAPFAAQAAKRIYSELFPNAIVGNTQPSAIAEKVENVSIAQVTSSNLANAEFAAHQIK